MRWRKRMLEDLDEDIRDHIARETQNNIDRGMSLEEAHYAAMRKFGNVTVLHSRAPRYARRSHQRVEIRIELFAVER
jgi:hypothetical protein